MPADHFIACHECDLLEHVHPAPTGGAGRCRRCGAVLYKHKRDSVDRTLALTIGGLILFAVAVSFPFLELRKDGLFTRTDLLTGVYTLFQEGYWEIAGLVAITTVIMPGLRLLGLLYILIPLHRGRTPPQLAAVFRFLRSSQPWNMMEVFMIGILVSVVKLAGMANLVPGPALIAFAVLIFILAGTSATLDPRVVWRRLGPYS